MENGKWRNGDDGIRVGNMGLSCDLITLDPNVDELTEPTVLLSIIIG